MPNGHVVAAESISLRTRNVLCCGTIKSAGKMRALVYPL